MEDVYHHVQRLQPVVFIERISPLSPRPCWCAPSRHIRPAINEAWSSPYFGNLVVWALLQHFVSRSRSRRGAHAVHIVRPGWHTSISLEKERKCEWNDRHTFNDGDTEDWRELYGSMGIVGNRLRTMKWRERERGGPGHDPRRVAVQKSKV